jgi:hypothetical protein
MTQSVIFIFPARIVTTSLIHDSFQAYSLWSLMMLTSATIGVMCIINFVRLSQPRLSTDDPIDLFQNPDNITTQETAQFEPPKIYEGLLYVLLLFTFEIIRANLYSVIFAIAYRKGQRLRAGLNWLMINKILRLRGGKSEKDSWILFF